LREHGGDGQRLADREAAHYPGKSHSHAKQRSSRKEGIHIHAVTLLFSFALFASSREQLPEMELGNRSQALTTRGSSGFDRSSASSAARRAAGREKRFSGA
jgi:hypothetical protein